jgi:hypothetical protein
MNLDYLKYVGDFDLEILHWIRGLVLFETMNRDLNLSGFISVKDLVLPKILNGYEIYTKEFIYNDF